MRKIILALLTLIILGTIFIWFDKKNSAEKQQDADANATIVKDTVLVNRDNPFPKSLEPTDLTSLFNMERSFELLTSSITIRAHVATALQQMAADMQTAGMYNLIVSSGYRTFDEQKELYDKMGSDYALPPGYSEHHTGLALDLGSTIEAMDVAPEGKWLADNAWRYGFILRYPAHKIDITHISFEPWHFRYVGLPHSERIYKQNLVLEEYSE